MQSRIDNFTFLGKNSLKKITGVLLEQPVYALTEILSNSWDAGATKVEITWPDDVGKEFIISDNGCGIAEAEFDKKWGELHYDRLNNQGAKVVFPNNQVIHRKAFGKNGIGRFSIFCFTNSYILESKNNGISITYKLTYHEDEDGRVQKEELRRRPIDASDTGLIIRGKVEKNYISCAEFEENVLIRFSFDPSFSVYLNGVKWVPETEKILFEQEIQTKHGVVNLRLLDTQKGIRKKSSGIIFWVNGKAVGVPKWKILGVKFEDGKNIAGRQLLFIIKADFLLPYIKDDWSGFDESSEELYDTVEQITPIIRREINKYTKSIRDEKKKEFLSGRKEVLRKFPLYDRLKIEKLWDVIRLNSAINYKDLNEIVDLFIEVSKSESISNIISQLKGLDSTQLSELNELLKNWNSLDFLLKSKILNERELVLGHLYNFSENFNISLNKIAALIGKNPWILGNKWDFQALLPYDDFYSYVISKLSVESKNMIWRNPNYNFIEWCGHFVSIISDVTSLNSQGFYYPEKVLILIIPEIGKSLNLCEHLISTVMDCMKDFKTHSNIQEIHLSIISKNSEDYSKINYDLDEKIIFNSLDYDKCIQEAYDRLLLIKKILERRGDIDKSMLKGIINESLERFINQSESTADGLKYLASLIQDNEFAADIELFSESEELNSDLKVYNSIERKLEKKIQELIDDPNYNEKWIAMDESGQIIDVNDDEFDLFERILEKKVSKKWLMKKVTKSFHIIHRGMNI